MRLMSRVMERLAHEAGLADLYEKEGRSGPMAFVVMEFVFTNQRDEVVATERFTRIYR